jgi:hypothetical protein
MINNVNFFFNDASHRQKQIENKDRNTKKNDRTSNADKSVPADRFQANNLIQDKSLPVDRNNLIQDKSVPVDRFQANNFKVVPSKVQGEFFQVDNRIGQESLFCAVKPGNDRKVLAGGGVNAVGVGVQANVQFEFAEKDEGARVPAGQLVNFPFKKGDMVALEYGDGRKILKNVKLNQGDRLQKVQKK